MDRQEWEEQCKKDELLYKEKCKKRDEENLGKLDTNLHTYYKQWMMEEEKGDFSDVLKSISDEDLEKLVPFVDLTYGYRWWNEEVPIDVSVMSGASYDQKKILLKCDEKGQLDVSTNFNYRLKRAIKNKDDDMFNIILSHKKFNYPGTGTYNRYCTLETLNLVYEILCEDNLKYLEKIYEKIKENPSMRSAFICHYFYTVNAKKGDLLDKGLKMFTYI